MAAKKRYQIIAEDIENKINSGEYKSGTYLPGEHRMEVIYDVCRSTVRTALNLLKEKNLIQAIPGCGNLVSTPAQPFRPQKRNGIIGLVLPSAFNRCYTFSPVPFITYTTVMEIMEKHDINVVAVKSNENIYKERQAVSKLLKQGVDGLIVFPCFTNRELDNDCGNYSFFLEVQNSGIPVILMDRYLCGNGLSGVFNDDVNGACNALLELAAGHQYQKIVYFKSTHGNIGARRYQGYCRAMEILGMEKHVFEPSNFRLDPGWTIPCSRHEAEVEKMLDKLVIDGDTLLFADVFTAPALGLYFPEHRFGKYLVNWACYDLPAKVFSASQPDYPWIERPYVKIAARSAELLLDKFNDATSGEPVVEYIQPELHYSTSSSAEKGGFL